MVQRPATRASVDCVIVGAGVLGLSIALELLPNGLHPVIIARDLPEDLDSKDFASPWAGANWSSSASTEKERHRDLVTFKRFEKMAEEVPELVRVTPFVFFSTDETYDPPWYKDLVHDFTALAPKELPATYKSGATYRSLTINTPKYLAYLANSLRSSGVEILRRSIESLDEALSDYPGVNLLINASGLGSKEMNGVKDDLMYTGRGQTVLVRAPRITTCYNHRLDWNTSTRRYIIPRPGPEGQVILGGTYEPNETATEPDPKVAERIMKDACEMCPDLGKWDELDVISHQVGLRPMRKGGMRLEHERRERPGLDGKEEYDCIHAYGIGSGGYQGSWGVAEEVAELAKRCQGQSLSDDPSREIQDQLSNVSIS